MVSDKETIKMLQEIIVQLQEQNAEHLQTITTLNSTIANLQNTIANLNETIDELCRKIFGKSREKFSEQETPDSSEEVTTVEVKSHTRAKHPKGSYDDLYSSLEVKEVRIDAEGIEQLLPWSDFIKEHCSGAVDTENICPENKPALPILDKTNV